MDVGSERMEGIRESIEIAKKNDLFDDLVNSNPMIGFKEIADKLLKG